MMKFKKFEPFIYTKGIQNKQGDLNVQDHRRLNRGCFDLLSIPETMINVDHAR